MRCPCCEKPLEVTHRSRYEDTMEHVSNPNGKPSMKDGYQCSNEFCVANNLRCTWISDGGIYIDPPEGIKWTVAHRSIEKCSVSGLYYALGSWEHYYNLGKKEKDRRTKKLYIGRWMVRIEPKDKGWDYPEDQRYYPSRWKYKFEFYRKETPESEGYTSFTPIHRMVIFSIVKFKDNYNEWEKTGNKRPLEECYRYATGKSPWGDSKDERIYAKISTFILNWFFSKKCYEVVKEYLEINKN